MTRIPTGLIGNRVRPLLCNMRWGLINLMLVGLMAGANQASATQIYKMAGGECLDSNRVSTLISPPGAPEVYQAGPRLCNDQVSVQVTMSDDYVPGTPFFYQNVPGTAPDPSMKIRSFSYSDGARSITTDFLSPQSYNGDVEGALPGNGQPSDLAVHWLEGFIFDARKDGTWNFGLEFGAFNNAYCGPGSTEGPHGICNFTGHYYSMGTYDGWIRVPEPPAMPMLGLSLAILAGFSYRRRKTLM